MELQRLTTYGRILVSIVAAVIRAITKRVGEDADIRVRADDHVIDTTNCSCSQHMHNTTQCNALYL